MHKAIQDFGTYQDDERVIDQVVKFNSQFYKLNLEINETIIKSATIKETETANLTKHEPHLGNMYNDDLIAKLIAVHILSPRDQIQGGEFRFKGWNEPTRTDNYGKVYHHDNSYPTWLNEQGTLFVIPALENAWTEMVVSGELNFVQYVFRGVNYR
tara:strand:- start:939 stop:1406 length:468 start_codon:yes stop_codon:yes gene_type:complete